MGLGAPEKALSSFGAMLKSPPKISALPFA
jgi:hypothetical protein